MQAIDTSERHACRSGRIGAGHPHARPAVLDTQRCLDLARKMPLPSGGSGDTCELEPVRVVGTLPRARSNARRERCSSSASTAARAQRLPTSVAVERARPRRVLASVHKAARSMHGDHRGWGLWASIVAIALLVFLAIVLIMPWTEDTTTTTTVEKTPSSIPSEQK